jgi:hypothetical protein
MAMCSKESVVCGGGGGGRNVTSPFSNPKLVMYIVNVMYDRGPSDVMCK